MASATGFGTPTPPQWTGVQTLVQNYLKSKSPEYQNFLAQQAKENAFRQTSQDLAEKQFQDTHAQSEIDRKAKEFQYNQSMKQLSLMTDPNAFLQGSGDSGGLGDLAHDRYGNSLQSPTAPTATPNQDESVPTGNDVGQELAPNQPQAGGVSNPSRYNRYGQLNPSTAAPGEPSSFKNPQQPSSQTTTTLQKSDKTETAVSPSSQGEDSGFDYNIYGFKVGTGHPGDVHASNPKTTFSKPQRQIPALKGDQKASNSLADVPSSSVPQPDSASLGAAPRLLAVPSATTASAAAAGGEAGPSTDAMQFGIHGKPFTALAARGPSGEGSHDASTPWEQLSSSEQKKVISGYQKGAPAGTTISPTEAVRAYRMQQMARSGFSTPQGMYMKSMKVDPNTGLPSVEYEASPFGGSGQSLEGMKTAAPVIEKINADPNYQAYIDAQRNAESIRSHINALKTGGGFAPGISDKTIMQEYLQTVAPRVRFNESTGEMVGGRTAGVPDEIIKLWDKVVHGAMLTDEHREAFAAAAERNVAEHWKAAQKSIGPQLNMLRESGIPADWIPGSTVQAPGSLPAYEATGKSTRVGNGTVEGSAGSGQHKTLDAKTAQEFLDQAKGNNARARELARSAGYDI